jgi:hypothetical protein
VSGASSYNVYRAKNGSASYSNIGSVSASSAATNYSAYVTGQGSYDIAPGIDSAYFDEAATGVIGTSAGTTYEVVGNVTSGSTTINVTSVMSGSLTVGQGIGGPGIPLGTNIASFGTGTGGAGTYTMTQAATANETGQHYASILFGDQGYTYYVTAVVGGVESSPSAYAYYPFIVNGGLQFSNGVFNGTIVEHQAAPSPTPLGNSEALQWKLSPSNWNLINTYSGYSSASYNISLVGYNYVNFAIWTPTSGTSLQAASESCGDVGLAGTLPFSDWGPPQLTANTWNTYKIPLYGKNGVYVDAKGFDQSAFYKITWQLTGTPTTTYNAYVEIWFTVD